MIRHLRKLAIINDASPDEVAILSNVTEGVDGASNFGLGDNDEVQPLSIEDQQTIHHKLTRSLDIRTLVGTSSEGTNIDGYVNNQTPVYLAGLGVDGFVLIGDRETTTGQALLVKHEQKSDRKVWAFGVTREVQPGHDTDTGLFEDGFWVGENGLGAYLWADRDSDGVADGWSATGFSTTSFSGGQQTLEADTTQRDFQRSIWFPFEGETLTFSIDIDSRTGSYATEQIEIEFVDTSDTVISSTTTTFSSTGRKSVQATTPSGSSLARVVCRLSLQAASGTVTEVVSDPMLALGTATTYTRH